MTPDDKMLLRSILIRLAVLPGDHPRIQASYDQIIKHFHLQRIVYPEDTRHRRHQPEGQEI